MHSRQRRALCALLLGVVFSISSLARANLFNAFTYDEEDLGTPLLAGKRVERDVSPFQDKSGQNCASAANT